MGETLRLSHFAIPIGKPEWDHEHCAFCWAKIVEAKLKKEGADLLIEAYTTENRHHWICPKCYEDFREIFQWKVVA